MGPIEDEAHALVDQVSALVYIDSNEVHPRSLHMSPEAVTIFGHDPGDYGPEQGSHMEMVHPEDRPRVQELWERSVRTRESFRHEYRCVRPDGRVVWVVDEARLARSADGEPLYWVGVLLDITERKAVEHELQTSEARYRTLVEQVPAVVYEMGPDDERRTIFVSRYVEELLGYTRAEWLDQPDIWIELLHPDDREIVLAAHDRHNETGESWLQEYRLIANDGRVIWVHDKAVLVSDEEGLPPRWHGIMLDITARKRLETQLGESNEELEVRVLERTAALAEANEMMTLEIEERIRAEAELFQARERYRLLVEDLPAVLFLWHIGDPGGDASLGYISPQIERLLGYTVEEWRLPSLQRERVHPFDRDRVIAAFTRSEVTGDPLDLEHRYLAKDGGIVWVHVYATLLKRDQEGRPLLFQGVLVDVTERKAAEAKAETAKERLEAAEAFASVGLYDFEVEHEPTRRLVFRYVTPSLARMIGSTVEQMMADPQVWVRATHPDDRDRVLAAAQEQLRTGEPSERSYRIIGPDGRVIWVRTEARSVARDEQGRPTRFQGVIVDVTPEMEPLARSQGSDGLLRAFVAALPGILWTKVVAHGPGTGRTVFIGPQVERILGFTEEELRAEPDHFRRMIHPEDRDRIRTLAIHHDRSARPWSQEFRMIARDGRVVWFHSVGVARRDDRGALVWHGVIFDITPSKPRSDEVVSAVGVIEPDV